MANDGDLKVLVAQVAAAYFSNSQVRPSEISDVVNQITTSLRRVENDDRRSADVDTSSAPPAAANAADRADSGLTTLIQPSAGEIRRSIRDDGLVSFEDGRSYKTLKRHLTTRGLTPAQYRHKWSLPDNYPMVCATSSAKRSALAKQIGLGRKDTPRAKETTRPRKAVASRSS